MARLHITEYLRTVADGAGRHVMAGDESAVVAQQTVSITSSSLQSNAFNERTTFVRIDADENCYFTVGSNPIASTSTKCLGAFGSEYFGVAPGQKIAVISGEGSP